MTGNFTCYWTVKYLFVLSLISSTSSKRAVLGDLRQVSHMTVY